jgi:hypothetical protein
LSLPKRCDNAAIRPISVCIPVAVTNARASPPRQALPLKTMFSACSKASVGSLGPGPRVTGCDSPVRVDRSRSTVPCLPLLCTTQWGKGTSLTGPTGPAGAAGTEATAYQSSHESEMPNGQSTDIATLPLVSAGYYTITATVDAEHSGNDTTTWSCSLLGAEPDGNTQNYVESDTSLQGNGAASNVTLPLVAGVEVVAGEKIVVNCHEDRAKKGDQADAVILATKMSVIGGVFNP